VEVFAMKTTTERKTRKRERHFQEKRSLKENKSIQEKSRDRGEFHRESIGYVLESGV
jgi:hypothetical protein